MTRYALIVDDSVSMRGLLHTTLKTLGYVVTEASNGQDALDKAGVVANFDLVVTDLNMPVMDGITFVSRLRKINAFKFTPVLFLTTETRVPQKDKAKAAGATGWLTKPFDAAQLAAVIARVVP